MADADSPTTFRDPREGAVERPDQQPKGDGGVDAPPHPGMAGMAPPKGERLEPEAQRAEQPRPDSGPGHDQELREGQVYRTPDGEERLVWVIRNGIAEYFARWPGERWRGTLDRGLLTTEAFAQAVGLQAA